MCIIRPSDAAGKIQALEHAGFLQEIGISVV